LGGGGFVGVIFLFLRFYISKRLNENDERQKHRRDNQIRRLRIEEELHHAYGRVFFWMHRAVTTGHCNGELQEAFEKLQEIEERKKDLDRETIVASEYEQKGK